MLLAPIRLHSSVAARPSVARPAAFTRGRWVVGPGRTRLSRSGLVCLAWLAVLVCRPVHASLPPVRVMLRGSALGSNPSSARPLGAFRRCLAKADALSSRPSRTSCTTSHLGCYSARSGSHRLQKGGRGYERIPHAVYNRWPCSRGRFRGDTGAGEPAPGRRPGTAVFTSGVRRQDSRPRRPQGPGGRAGLVPEGVYGWLNGRVQVAACEQRHASLLRHRVLRGECRYTGDEQGIC